MKEKYRKASKQCHLDVVRDEQEELAIKLFAELSQAYEKNDLQRVNAILSNLDSRFFFVSKSEAINEGQLLQTEIEN